MENQIELIDHNSRWSPSVLSTLKALTVIERFLNGFVFVLFDTQKWKLSNFLCIFVPKFCMS